MKPFHKLMSILLVWALMLSLPFLSAAASEEPAGEILEVPIPQEIITAAVTAAATDAAAPAGEAEPAEAPAPTEEPEPTETPAPAEEAEPTEAPAPAGETESVETDSTTDTLSAAGTWDSCDVLVEGTFRYDYAFQVLELVNAKRTSLGLKKLVMDQDLLDHAMLRAVQNALYWEHTQPDGATMGHGSGVFVNGENIACIYTTPKAAVTGWTNSSGHYSLMVSKNYVSTGVGVFEIGGYYYWVQIFSTTAANTASSSAYPSTADASLTISVADSIVADTITVSLSDRTLNVGDTARFSAEYSEFVGSQTVYYDLPAKGLQYTSSDTSVCTVSADGTVTAQGEGTATITAWYPGYKSGAWTFSVTVSIPKHTCSYKGVVTTAAGCETEGVKTFTCSICKKSYTETIAAAGHSMSTSGTVTKKPGCVSFGKMTYTCKNCDHTESTLIAPTGHSYDSGKITVKPTASAAGTRLYTCTACGGTKTESVAFLRGDVTMNEKVNTTDLIRLMKHLTGQSVTINKNAADTNGDSRIDLLDAIRLMRHLTEGKKLG